MTADTNEPADSLRPYRAGFAFSFFNAPAFFIGLGTPLVLLAETLGASSSQVGLMYSFIFLLLPIQILATVGLPRFGYKRQVLVSWGIRCFGLVVPLIISLMAPEGYRPDLVIWLMGAIFLFCFFRSIGTCGVQPWLFDLLPEKLQNKYFSTDMMVAGTSGILSLVFSAFAFSFFEGYTAFSIQFAVAVVGGVVALFALSRLPSVPSPEPFEAWRIFVDAPRLLKEGGNFRNYLILTVIWTTTSCAVTPFGAYFLRAEIGLPRDVIVLFTAMASVGGISGAWFFRKRLDLIGIRNAFVIVILLHVTVFSIWGVFVGGNRFYGLTYGPWIFLIVSAYVLLGVAGSCYMASHLKYLAFISAGKDRALRVSLQTSVTGFLTGLAAIGWGHLFRESSGEAGMNVSAFLFYFVSISIIQLGMLPFLIRLPEPSGDFKLIFNPRGIARPFRSLATIPVFRYRQSEDSKE